MSVNANIFFTGLNQNQVEAVKSTEGFVRIIAGAGSGKTRVLVNRYAYIVEHLGMNPSNILNRCINLLRSTSDLIFLSLLYYYTKKFYQFSSVSIFS